MKYTVVDFETWETIASFDTKEERSEWLAKNSHKVWNVVDYAYYTNDGRRIAGDEITK